MSDAPQGPQPYPGQTYGTPAAGQHAPTEWLGSGDPPRGGTGAGPGEHDGSGRGGRRGIIVGAVVAVVVLLAGGAVFAFQALSGGGPQPAEAVPSSAIGFVRVDLDPSADQKMNALSLLRRVPQFEEETGITSDTDDLRKRLFELALKDSVDCDNIDYADDIEPWLGDRAGAAAIPAGEGHEPDPLVVLQVTDEDAARDGLEALTECGFADMTPGAAGGVAFVGEYALIAETQELADQFAAETEESPLSADVDYTADLEALDGEGIVSAWVDLEAVVTAVGDSADGDEYVEAAALSGLGDISSVAMSLRANSDSLELAAVADGVPTGFGDTAETVQTLPDSTLFAYGFSGGSDLIEAGWEQMSENLNRTDPGSVDRFTRDLEASTGLRFPEDLQTLVGDDFALAFDGEPLELDPATGEPDLTALRLGVRTSSDIVAVADLVTRIESAVGQFYPLDLVDQEVDGGRSLIAIDEAYADDLAADGDLAGSANYQAAVADPNDAAAVYFVDFDRALTLTDQLDEGSGGELDDDDREALEVLRAFGLSASVDGDYTTATVRLVFD